MKQRNLRIINDIGVIVCIGYWWYWIYKQDIYMSTQLLYVGLVTLGIAMLVLMAKEFWK